MSMAICTSEACEALTSTEFVRGSATVITRACCNARSLWLDDPPVGCPKKKPRLLLPPLLLDAPLAVSESA